MKPAEYQQQQDRVVSFKKIQGQIDTIKTLLDRVDKYRDIDGGLGGKGIVVGFQFGDGRYNVSMRFDLKHRISQEVIDMLNDEVLRLEQERDNI